MSLWGTGTDGNESKPKWLTRAGKRNIFADSRGWVERRPDGTEEVLVAVGDLAESLGAPTVADADFAVETIVAADDGELDFNVYYNEPVVVSGTPQITVSGLTPTTLDYNSTDSDPTKGLLVFSVTTSGEGGNTAGVAADSSISLNGGTIIDETDATTSGVLALNNDELTVEITSA